MTTTTRTFAALASLTLAAGVGLSGCSSENASTDCSVDACTVTYDRGKDASVTILGVEASLVSVEGNQARLRVGDSTVTVPADGQAQAGDFTVSVQDVTSDEVVVRIARGGGG